MTCAFGICACTAKLTKRNQTRNQFFSFLMGVASVTSTPYSASPLKLGVIASASTAPSELHLCLFRDLPGDATCFKGANARWFNKFYNFKVLSAACNAPQVL